MLTPRPEKIPQELKVRPQWVCWSLEEREGKPTKVPKNPKTGGNAMANDPGTWGEFDLAVGYWEDHKNNGIAGIGYEFGADDPFTGIDLDKCRDPETGQLKFCAQVIIEYLNSSSEASPSGTGTHTIAKAKWPVNAGNSRALPCGMKIEVYDRLRYFTMTGAHLEGTPTTIEARQAELMALHQEVFGKSSEAPKQAPPKDPSPAMEMSDFALIDKAKSATNGHKFSALWDGDTSEYGGDDSRADLALCSLLAFWTGPDPGRIDQLFRQSGLMRKKWDRPTAGSTYGAMTINKALAGMTEFYTPGKSQYQPQPPAADDGQDCDQAEREAIRGEAQGKPQGAPNTAARVNVIADLNRKHAVVMLGGKCVILNEVVDPVFNRPDVTFSSVPDFKNFYANRRVEVPSADGTGTVALSKLWLDSPRRRQYSGIVFAPGADVDGFYNLYRGLAVEPVKGDCSLYWNHVRDVICAGNEEIFRYIKAWMTHPIKNLGDERSGTSVVLRGKQGTGKGCCVSQYGRVYGGHFLHVTNQNQLTGRFNSHLKDALLVFCDEGIWAGDRTAEGVLKAMITEPVILCEPKGKDAFAVKNHINLVVASNSSWVIPAGLEERRFLVLDVSDKHMQDHTYFGAIFQQMNHGGLEALLYDLLEMDTSAVDLRKIPRTAALLDQIIHTMPTVQKFWFERLRAGTLIDEHREWEPYVITEKLYDAYLKS